MTRTSTWLAAAAVSLATTGAWAQGVYGELGYSALQFDQNQLGSGQTIKPSMVRGILGYELNPNLAVEGLLGLSAGSDDVRIGGLTVHGKVDSIYGVFLKPKIPLGAGFELFARLGAAGTKVSANMGNLSVSETGGSWAYGAGASYQLGTNTSINADYMNYYDRKGIRVEGINVGLGVRF